MIDSNVQTTIGSPIEWYKLEVMRDVINVKEAWESYSKTEASGIQVDLSIILARTQSLFNSLFPYLKRKLEDKLFQQIQKDLFTNKTQEQEKLRKIFWDIQLQLDKDHITRMDTRKSYDGTRVEKENSNFNL